MSGEQAKTRDVARGSLSTEDVAAFTDALTRHYGEPVRPVSQYCDAFRTWQKAISDKLGRIERGEEQEEPHEIERFKHIAAALATLTIPIYKSNLLARLIYDGEKLLTRMCPEHKGQWSGCPFPEGHCRHGCTIGGNTTGWLPENPFGDFADFGGPTVGYCSKCGEARDAFYTCRDGGATVPKEKP